MRLLSGCFQVSKTNSFAHEGHTEDASGVVDAKFDNKAFFAPIRQPRSYAYGIFALCYGTAAGTANYFLPQIIGRFGLSSIKTNRERHISSS